MTSHKQYHVMNAIHPTLQGRNGKQITLGVKCIGNLLRLGGKLDRQIEVAHARIYKRNGHHTR